MINALRYIASKAKVTLDTVVDDQGDPVYNWEVVIGKRTLAKDGFFSFDECIRSLIEEVTPKLDERDK
jgi:hypothetical protein